MASYAFATLQARQALQELWEQGKTVKDMAVALDVPLSTLYTELRRGRSGVRLPDQRLQYDASLAQLRMQQELERRGKQSRRGTYPHHRFSQHSKEAHHETHHFEDPDQHR